MKKNKEKLLWLGYCSSIALFVLYSLVMFLLPIVALALVIKWLFY